jgi:SAM-dependent methyltransferase
VSHECSKAALRRVHDPAFHRYFSGHLLDVGAGPDGMSKQMHVWDGLRSVQDWDVADGDAQELDWIGNGMFDCVHASHLLEHVRDPLAALTRWLEVVRHGGHVVVLVPDEDMYEQGIYPSTFNPDHKHTLTIWKAKSWSPVSVNLLDLVRQLPQAEPVKLERLERTFNPNGGRYDRTAGIIGESSIELILRRRA